MSEHEDQNLHDILNGVFSEVRAARTRTARINRGLTSAMAMGEDMMDAYERLSQEEEESSEDDDNLRTTEENDS